MTHAIAVPVRAYKKDGDETLTRIQWLHNLGIRAKVIEATTSMHGHRITTLQLRYHRFIHGEFLTHRVFSRNSMSSRAIPVRKMLAQVWSDPAMPVHWGANQPGMQAKDQLKGLRLAVARAVWRGAGKVACAFVWVLDKVGLHKQVANRILEPWQWMHTVVTATEWGNFKALRQHSDAQPEFKALADVMDYAMRTSPVRVIDYYDTSNPVRNWHLPYVSIRERDVEAIETLRALSAARCARVSYLTHDGLNPSRDADLKLFERLVGSEPLHASPIEHQAVASMYPGTKSNNFVGWVQHRELFSVAHTGEVNSVKQG